MVEDLLNEIKTKIKKITTHNEQLKLFNYKMESLLISIDAYSFCYENQSKSKYSNFNDKSMKSESVHKQHKVSNPDLEKVSKLLKNEKEKINKNVQEKINKNVQEKINKNVQEIIIPDLSHTFLDTSLLFDNKNDLFSRALMDPNLNKVNKSHLIKILDLLSKNKDGILWEDIIHKSGVPRYKCIEILNYLVKTDPPIMTKKRDKGFTCFLNNKEDVYN